MATFTTDKGGLAFRSDCKISLNSDSTWNTKLSQIGRWPDKSIIIVTYSLPLYDKYTIKILDKRPTGKGITIVAHKQFEDRAGWLKKRYPELTIILVEEIHAKVVLIEPHTVWISSENFGKSTWLEASVGIHDKEVYDYVMGQLFKWYEELDNSTVTHL